MAPTAPTPSPTSTRARPWRPLASCAPTAAGPGPWRPLKDQAVDINRATTAADPVVLPAATGGDGTLTYTLECDAAETGYDATSKLPPGLSFAAASRELSGAPTTSGTWNMVYMVTDADTTDPDSDSATIDVPGHAIGAPRWADMALDEGRFATGSAGTDWLSGSFHGPGHEEAWGVFDTTGHVGSFGARRQP